MFAEEEIGKLLSFFFYNSKSKHLKVREASQVLTITCPNMFLSVNTLQGQQEHGQQGGIKSGTKCLYHYKTNYSNKK